MRKALTGFAVVSFVAGVALLAVSLSQSPSALAQETEREFFFQPLEDVLDELVQDEVITEDQRTKIASALEKRMVRFGKGLRGVPHLEIVAEVLETDVDELVEQLRDGATIAEIAGDQTQEVVDALVAEHGARIDEAVTDERISEERAGELREALADRVEAMVNGEAKHRMGPFGPDGFLRPHSFDFFKNPRGLDFFKGLRDLDGFRLGSVFGMDSIAEALGLEVDEVMDRLADGESLLDIAEKQTVDVQDIIDAVLADVDEKLADLVADERVTRERADALRERIADTVEWLVNSDFPPFGEFHFEGFPPWPDLEHGFPFPEGFEMPEDFAGSFHGPHGWGS